MAQLSYVQSNATGVNATERTPRQDRRYRFQFRFWLDVNKDHEMALADALEELKSRRKMQPIIRDALRLFIDLSRGKTDVLAELFPFAVPSQNIELDKLHAELRALRATLDRAPAATLSPPRSVGADFDVRPLDGEITIKRASGTTEDNKPNFNFLLASTMQIYGNVDALPDEVICYGLRTKRITAKNITRPLSSVDSAAPKQNTPSLPAARGQGRGASSTFGQGEEVDKPKGPKAMDVPQFAPPAFDDDEDLLDF